MNFKWWKNPKPVDDDRVKEELVDILHFFVSMCIKMGMDADELCSRYKEERGELQRQRGLSDRKGYAAEDPIDRDGRAR